MAETRKSLDRSKNFWLWGVWGKRTIKQPFLTQKVQGRIRDIVLGNNFIIALKEDGTLVSWGEDNYGCLGLGTEHSISAEPMLIRFPAEHGDGKIISVQFGNRHVLALSDQGKVYSWGDNSRGQLGLTDIQTRYEPNFVSELGEAVVKQIVAVGDMSYALTGKGLVYAWGENEKGGLALDREVKLVTKPELMKSMLDEHHPVQWLEVKECQGTSGGKAGKTLIAFVEMAEPLFAKDYPQGFDRPLGDSGHAHHNTELAAAEGTDRDRDASEDDHFMRKVMDNTQDWWNRMLRVRHGSPYSEEQSSGTLRRRSGDQEQSSVLQLDTYVQLDILEKASLELDMLIESAKAQLLEMRAKAGIKNVKFVLDIFMDDCKLRKEKIRRIVSARQLVEYKKSVHSISSPPTFDPAAFMAELDSASQQLARMLRSVRDLPTDDDIANGALRDSLAECLECRLQVNEAAKENLRHSGNRSVNPFLPALKVIKERWADLKRFSIRSMYTELMLRGNIGFDTEEEMLAFLVHTSNAKINQILSIDEHMDISRSVLVDAVCYDLLRENGELRKLCNRYQLKVFLMEDRGKAPDVYSAD